MKISLIILLILVLLSCSQLINNDLSVETLTKLPSFQNKYKVGYFKQQTDHFNFLNNNQFQIKFLYNDTFWVNNATHRGPILFYAGNEGSIEGFYDNTGFMTEYLAPKLNGLVIFVEHRYFGESMPYGDKSYDPQYMGQLSASQALQDFANFLSEFRSQNQLNENAFIGFGGSYGGMLAAWLRMKYPFVIDGVIAASAPILQYVNYTSDYSFNEIVTQDYEKISPLCPSTIRKVFNLVQKYSTEPLQYKRLQSLFNTCENITTVEDVNFIETWMLNAFQYMAMTDYPYQSNFLSPMPAWPVEASCNILLNTLNQKNRINKFLIIENEQQEEDLIIKAVQQAAELYYNGSGQQQCNQIKQQYDYYNVYFYNATLPQEQANLTTMGFYGWNYLACTEQMMPVGSNGQTDMFNNRPWNTSQYSEYCYQTFGVIPRSNHIIDQFGGDKQYQFLNSYSNIVFSNGRLDPWHPGGILKNISESVISILMENSAHHLDLRAPNPQDPLAVVQGRQIEEIMINKWIKQQRNHKQ